MRIIAAVLAFSSVVLAQSRSSPYAGQESRSIKALAPEEVQAYLSGQGMGLARAAELNHYPGPKHVIELASQLELTEGQLKRTKHIYDRMHREAVRIGRLIIEREKQLDQLYAREKIADRNMWRLVRYIARLQGELRATHLRAHLEMKSILSRKQIDRYDHLRGYSAPGEKGPHHHSHAGK